MRLSETKREHQAKRYGAVRLRVSVLISDENQVVGKSYHVEFLAPGADDWAPLAPPIEDMPAPEDAAHRLFDAVQHVLESMGTRRKPKTPEAAPGE